MKLKLDTLDMIIIYYIKYRIFKEILLIHVDALLVFEIGFNRDFCLWERAVGIFKGFVLYFMNDD